MYFDGSNVYRHLHKGTCAFKAARKIDFKL